MYRFPTYRCATIECANDWSDRVRREACWLGRWEAGERMRWPPSGQLLCLGTEFRLWLPELAEWRDQFDCVLRRSLFSGRTKEKARTGRVRLFRLRMCGPRRAIQAVVGHRRAWQSSSTRLHCESGEVRR